jgi:hypothetical protein
MAEMADPDSGTFLPFAVRHLELETPEQTAEFLIPFLTHGVRDAACAAAGRLAELGCGPGVVELLEGSDVFDNHTRMMHMWGAIRAGGREVTLALVAATRNRRGSIRSAAAFALGGRLYPEAVDALIALTTDEDGYVRTAAAQSLGVTPDPRAVDALIRLGTKDERLRASIEALRALRRRDFRHLPRVKEAFEQVAGTPRDAGGIDPERPSLAEQPAHSFVLRSWAEHPEEDLVCSLTYESSLCYDAHRRRVVMWGAHGRRYDTPQTGQTWFYYTGRNQWVRLTDSRHWPNGTCCIRGTMYDNANHAVISPRSGGSGGHGWHNALRRNLADSSPWVLDVKTDQWYAACPVKSDGGGFMPGSHDPVHGVTLWWKDRLFAYDVYANRWHRFRPTGAGPKYPGDTGGVFDPKTGRFIGVGANSTWAFDPAANAWVDLKPEGPQPPACPMVYDSANDVMIALKQVGEEVGVWIFHLRENRWERLPAVHPGPAHGKIWDAAYDEKNNVVVVSGKSAFGYSGTLNNRETWTYRYKPVDKAADDVRAPRDVKCVTAGDGTVEVRWVRVGEAATYRVERGVGEQPWLVKWEKVAEVNGTESSFKDNPPRKTLTFYRVLPLGADGKPGRPSLPGRTAPRMISRVTAVVHGEGGVQVRWKASRESDVVGYHVYRSPVALGSAWGDRFSPGETADTLERITAKPLAEPELLDTAASVSGPVDALTWPKTFAYVIRPVNAWGLEGGPSPVTLALPDPPGPVRVIPWADGRRLVLWSDCLSGGVAGFHLMRMDDWHRYYVFRLQAAPLAVPAFWDSEDFPTVDRRRYYASGVDALGTIGIPTSGAWSHGYP